MEIKVIQDKLLSIKTKAPQIILEAIDRSKLVNEDEYGNAEVWTYFGLGEAHILNNLKIPDVPSPMRTQYKWRGLYKPFEHQRATAEFLTLNKRAYCFNQQGTGKTNAVIWAADYLMTLGIIKRVLIVAPLSILDAAWKKDLFKTAMHRSVDIAHGNRDKRKSIINGGAEFVIINYDGVEIVEKEIAQGGFDLIVLDECFPKGTKVFTPMGTKSIEHINIGDIIDTSWGPRPVTKVFTKTSNTMVEVFFENGKSIKCTEDHPFATTEGWVKAKYLTDKICISSEDLPYLRDVFREEGIPPQNNGNILFQNLLEKGSKPSIHRNTVPLLRRKVFQKKQLCDKQPFKILQQKMRGQGKNRKERGDKKLYSVQQTLFYNRHRFTLSGRVNMLSKLCYEMEMGQQAREHGTRDSNNCCEKQRSGTTKQRNTCFRRDKTKIKGIWGQNSFFKNTRREWYWNDSSRRVISSSNIKRVSTQLCNPYPPEAGERLSNALQSGLCKPYQNDSGRGRWEQPQQFNTSSTRQKEGSFFKGVRVDCVKSVQQDSVCDVWNLEVEGPHDYVIEGMLVHNCTFIKTHTTNRWKSINKLVTPTTWLWQLTGTPAAQSPVDAYGLAKMMDPKSVPRAFNAFRDIVQIKQSVFTYVNRPEAEQIVHSILQPAIRFTKEECLDLPELLYQTREVPLSAQQEKYYKLLKKEMLMQAGGEEISAANAAVALNKLLQLSAGSVYSDSGEVIEFDVKQRTAELLGIIEEASHKVIVFVMFRHSIELVEKALSNAGHSVDVIHGGIAVGKRNQIFSDFQTAKDPRILVIQPQAAAHGVTLHAANTIVWWGITLSLETYLQANARIHRAGQVNACNVVHLVGSPVEKKVLKVLESKGASQTKLLDLYKDVVL